MKNYILLLSLFFLAVSCKKEKVTIFGVETQEISLTQIDKNNFKKELEFISMAHTDLFGVPIESYLLGDAIACYASNSDKGMISDMIVRSFLNRSDLEIPSNSEMRADLNSFVTDTYKRFYHRNPNEFEKWSLKNKIETDLTVMPDMVYYAVMLSDEYRKF